ncbi:MAG: type transport system ATP-binding protein [Thermoplasmata archaeon]|jgi:pimeloyl-ACP methyl ester carboxylesterase|nr:type transport system ATP-binding protein [Thermoplasmata archaeon]
MRALGGSPSVRGAVVVAFLVTVAGLAGCADDAPGRAVAPADVGFDPAFVRVTGVRVQEDNLTSFDGRTMLAMVAHVPTTDPVVPLPTIVFLHGWGGSKASFASRLDEAARAGFLAVAYDARGFGDSTGASTVAGVAERDDLAFLLDTLQDRYDVGRIGLVGGSYGGGQALLAWAENPDVTTAVSHYGWFDLAEGLAPGGVPKLAWGEFLYGYGRANGGTYDPIVDRWYVDAHLRTDMPTILRQMRERSVAHLGLDATAKPLFVCQGLQETLFPQMGDAQRAAGFVRAYGYTGGHGEADAGCWERTMDWFRFFLQGLDTRVDSWPALETIDADGATVRGYTSYPEPAPTLRYLRAPDLGEGPSDATFEVRQSFVGSPLQDPSALWDQAGQPNNAVPNQLREDPTATAFAWRLDHAATLVGSAEVVLEVGRGPAFQVVATLDHVDAAGNARVLGHAAAADLAGNATSVTLRFPWTHAVLEPGEQLVLRVASNDLSWFLPLPADYTVTFTGGSRLVLPLI